jgi:hypothetical protein
VKNDDEKPTGKFREAVDDEFAKTQPLPASIVSNSSGSVAFDDLGQPRWRWVTEQCGPNDSLDSTFDYLKALDNTALTIQHEDPPAKGTELRKESGYNPYDTVRLKIDSRFLKK